jgi:hypothetical protein
MTIRPETRRYIFCSSAFILLLQAAVATGQSKKSGVTISYDQFGTSRIVRFANSNSYPAQDPVAQVKRLVRMRFL